MIYFFPNCLTSKWLKGSVVQLLIASDRLQIWNVFQKFSRTIYEFVFTSVAKLQVLPWKFITFLKRRLFLSFTVNKTLKSRNFNSAKFLQYYIHISENQQANITWLYRRKSIFLSLRKKICTAWNTSCFWCLIFLVFFNCYLADPRPISGHSQGDRLTNPVLITAFWTISTRSSPGAS